MRSDSEESAMQLLVTKAEAAAALSISVRQLEVYMRRGEIPVQRLGRRCVRIEQAALDRFVDRLAKRQTEAGA
jgi:excisionase family DNA binding protein